MKKTQLKKALKPIIRECIQEALIEEGLLSKIISEVIKGTQPLLNNNSYIKENQKAKESEQIEQKRLLEERWEEERERKRKLLDATGLQADIFEGTQPLSTAGNINESSLASGPLAGTDPNDAGVDISGIIALGGNRWKHLVE